MFKFDTHPFRRATRTLGRSGIALAAISFATLTTAPAAARQDGKEAAAEPQKPQTVLAFDCAGLPAMLVSEKDAALVRALQMLPARIEELRLQVPEFNQVPPDITNLIFSVLGHPARLAVTNKGFDPDTGMPGIGATLSFHMKDEQDSASMDKAFNGVRAMAFAGAPTSESQRWKGFTDLPLPFGVLSYGSRRAPDGWRYEMIFGAVDSPDAPFATLPTAAAGVRPVFRGVLDLAALTPVTQMLAGFLAMASPQGQSVVKDFRDRGLMGPGAVAYEVVQGYTELGSVNVMRVRRMGNFAEISGLSRQPLEATDLAIIPADATAAFITRVMPQNSWKQIRDQIEAAAPGEYEQAMARFRDALSIDFEQDVLAALGDTAAIYVSDSTGGGSILSAVAAMSLSDPDRMAASLEKAAGAFNRMAAQQIDGPGAVRMDMFTQGGVRFLQLRFAGLPIPAEPTFAVAGKWLMVGATPAATVAAASLVADAPRAGGLGLNPVFAKHRIADRKPISVGFVDSARTMSRGYPLLSFATSAIANAMRSSSPEVPAREPGFILPSYAALSRDVRPIISQTYWDGEDMILETTFDKSMLVNAAAFLGIGDLGQIVGSMMLGAGIGAAAAEEMGGAGEDWQSRPPVDTEVNEDEDAAAEKRRPAAY